MSIHFFDDKNKGKTLEAQELLFRKPYTWLITFSITTLNFLITYNLKNIGIQYLYFYVLDIITTYIIIEFYALGVKVLNKKIPLHQDFVKRVTYQLTLHTLSVVIFSILLNELLDYIFFNGERLSLSFNFYTQDTVLALVFILFFHCLYLGLYLLSTKRIAKEEKSPKVKVIQGMSFKLMDLKEILCVYTSLGTTYVVNDHNKKFVLEKTLGEFEEMSSGRFFRANRQFIVSLAIIDSFKSAENGKVEVFLNAGTVADLSGSIFVSRSKASSFRAWINAHRQ
ncbi:LytTR family DNA-binding domain-containing protein [Spongiimicrobium sp. 3-5]|uniref:LytTR family DNA-binding domain-containing protein n=1 Tax=Spongiimicrobium sp. 3-5 TaxID=3332596 RepID=UPI00397FBCB7